MRHKYGGMTGVKMLAMPKDRHEALHWQHTHYRKWQVYPEVQVWMGASHCAQDFLLGRHPWWVQS